MTEAGRLLHIYCDESRQTADRYMVIGGIITTRQNEQPFSEAMSLYRQSNNMYSELKWTKVSDQKQKEYFALIDLFFSLNRAFHFKAIVIDTQELDHKRYNKSDSELGFYKLMYQFLLHSFGSYLQPDDKCIIFLDQRTTSHYKLSTLCAILNNGLRKKYGFPNPPISNIQAQDSKKSDLVQIADILMGAIGYERTGRTRPAEQSGVKFYWRNILPKKPGWSTCSNRLRVVFDTFPFGISTFATDLKSKTPQALCPCGLPSKGFP